MRSKMQGLTLVELMVAMVLGLVVIGGAVSLTLANRQSYRANEGLSQLQESARTAFELLSRDLRQAGVSGCDNVGRISNVLDTSGGTEWWMEWFGLLGHEGSADTSAAVFGVTRGDRVNGTDAIQMQGIDGVPLSIDVHDTGSYTMEINADAADIVEDDVMIACDFDHAAIFRVTAYDDADVTLTHDAGAATGNCSRGLGFPTDCGSVSGNAYPFPRNALLGRLFATDWYVGQTERAAEGGRALFRRRLGSGGIVVTEEIVAGVTDMQLSYRRDGGVTFAATVAAGDWDEVNAIRVELAVESADTRVSTDLDTNSGRLRRNFTQIITLRNRVP